jgi:hypothetical protein
MLQKNRDKAQNKTAAPEKRKTIGYSSSLQCVYFQHLRMADCGRNM